MRLESYPEVWRFVQDLKTWVATTPPEELLWSRQGEPDPLSIDLSFHPPIAEKTVETLLDPDVCVLCPRRIGYKPRQFENIKISQPYLILIHNSFILDQKNYYDLPAAEKLFHKMIYAGLGISPKDVLVREVLRCYFGKNDESDPQNTANCSKHIREDIDTYSLKGILILGQAAPLLFGADRQKLADLSGKVIELEGLPAVVTSGPERLLYMHEKGFEATKLEEEKARILKHLNLFKEQVMNTNP